MKNSYLTLLLIFVVAAVTCVAHAEQAVDVSLGKVKMRNPAQLDKKGRSEVAAVAAKIKMNRSTGVIKLRGDFPGAATAEEYLSKTVFMATEVEKYLKPLLTAKFQVFVTASAYSGVKRAGENYVEILLSPHQMLLEERDSFNINVPLTSTTPEASAAEAVSATPLPVEAVGNSGLLSPQNEDADNRDNASKREREQRSAEDPVLANELVNKAKARAAERAKRRAAEN